MNNPTFVFGMDAFRDNEHERSRLHEAIDRINAGDEVEDLTLGELERLVEASKAEGTNAEAKQFALYAQNYLDNEYERIGVAREERNFRDYWEGKFMTNEDRDTQDLKDAGRYRG